LAFFLTLQVPGPHRQIGSEYLYVEQASRLLVALGLVLSGIWAYHLYLIDGKPRINWPWMRLLPFLLTVAFGALFYYENNWDLEMREQTWGIAVAGATLLPLLLLPMAWYRIGKKDDPQPERDHGNNSRFMDLLFKRQGLLLSLSGLAIMALSQVLDYHHDHSDRGLAIFRELGGIRGLEECLEYWALLALFQSLFLLAVVGDTAVAELVKNARWKQLVVAVGIMSVGNGFWLGREWDGWWLYFHVLGLVVALTGLVLTVRELKSFIRGSNELNI